MHEPLSSPHLIDTLALLALLFDPTYNLTSNRSIDSLRILYYKDRLIMDWHSYRYSGPELVKGDERAGAQNSSLYESLIEV